MEPGLTLMARLGAGFITFLGHTWKIAYVDERWVERARYRFPQVIYAFWHGRLLPLSFTHRGRKIHVLASEHRDGELMGRTISHLGFGHVRGSSSRGGARAIMNLVGKVRQGYDLGITVDGPRGPRHVVKPGCVEIAKLSGAALVPITTSSSRHWSFSSWDGFQLPQPFTKVIVYYGEPLFVSPRADGAEVEQARLILQERLEEITVKADEYVAETRGR